MGVLEEFNWFYNLYEVDEPSQLTLFRRCCVVKLRKSVG